ncbi:MAG TPA: TMEM175 family protein [Actinomycetota bacterium]
MSEPTENTDEHRRFARRHDPTRVMALSDGVFAIVITLLVLEVHVPDLSGGRRLADALEEIRPSFVAFLISFLVIAIAWTGHRDLFSFIRLTDRNLVWLNLLYMLPLSLLPFGAALIARHPEEAVALRIYGLLLVAIALTRLLVWLYATNRPHLLFDPIDRPSRRLGVLLAALPAALYVVAILIAERLPTASLWIYAGAPILYFMSLFISRSQAPPGAAERDFT